MRILGRKQQAASLTAGPGYDRINLERRTYGTFETGRTGWPDQPTAAPKDSDNDFLCALQLERIAKSLEEILRLVKEDQERMKKLND